MLRFVWCWKVLTEKVNVVELQAVNTKSRVFYLKC